MQDNLQWVDKVVNLAVCQCKTDLLLTWEDLLALKEVLDQWASLQVEFLLVVSAHLDLEALLLVLELEPSLETMAKILSVVVNLLSDDLNFCCSMNLFLIPLLTFHNFLF
jgi:hypothetical protein